MYNLPLETLLQTLKEQGVDITKLKIKEQK